MFLRGYEADAIGASVGSAAAINATSITRATTRVVAEIRRILSIVVAP
jgi:hypothetical protein